MNEILMKSFLGNSVKNYLVFLAIFAGGMIILKIIKNAVVKRLEKMAAKTVNRLDDIAVEILSQKIFPMLYFGVFYLGIRGLRLGHTLSRIVSVLGVAVVTIYAVMFITDIIVFFIKKVASQRAGEGKEAGLGGLIGTVKLLVWSAAAIFFLDNLGFKVSTVLAGLGVGGVAIALAAQAVLGDLFSYFAIFFDRPFEVGDFIIVGELMGVVENIGIKTTRIRSLGGEQLIFSNNDLTSSRIRNYKRMAQRRVVFSLGVTYETPRKRLEDIPKIIKEIIESIEDTVFDRSHFAAYGNFSLNFENVYYVIGGDYNKYMDIQQEINLRIKKEFEERNIEFAYPTQQIYLEKSQ